MDDGPEWGVFLRDDCCIRDRMTQEQAISHRRDLIEPDYAGNAYHPNDLYVAAIWMATA